MKITHKWKQLKCFPAEEKLGYVHPTLSRSAVERNKTTDLYNNMQDFQNQHAKRKKPDLQAVCLHF